MKILSFFLLFLALNVNAMALSSNSDLPVTEPKLIYNHTSFEYRTLDNAGLSLFKNIDYDDVLDHLEIQTKDRVNYIQLFDEDGLLEFQMPIESKHIHLSINDFKPGTYTLNFKTDESPIFIGTKLTIK